MSLPEFSTRYPTTIAMATLAVVLLGVLSVGRLGTDLFPNLTPPVVTAVVSAPGKSPREMEERYTRRLERAVSAVSGVRRVSSVTRAGQCAVVAEFGWGVDMDFALLDVQKGVSPVASDPDVESVDVARDDPRALPVMRIAMVSTTGAEIDALVGVAETVVKPKLEGLDGVASATLEGGAEKEVRVLLDPYLLEAYGQDAAAVARRIRTANQDVSGGTLRDARQAYQVKGLGRLRTLDDLSDLIVGERRPGTEGQAAPRVPVRVGDLARVEMRYEDPDAVARLDGATCLGIAIYREASASTVTVARAVAEAVEGLSKDLPDARFTVVENQARYIEDALDEVESSAVYGSILAVAVLIAFLRSWRATFTIALAIPVSILATFTLMYFRDVTLNVMSLGGLALGAGMLVDNAIVVIENIHRHRELGADARQAAAAGATEVGTAILASTLTTVCVFLPIVYLQGLSGELFKEQAWTVAFSLLSSLAVAMTAVPMLASRMLRPARARARAKRSRLSAFVGAAMDRKGWTLAGVAACLAAAVPAMMGLQGEFIPREAQGLFRVNLSLPEGTRLEVTDAVARRVSEIIRETGKEAVGSVYVYTGTDPTRAFGSETTATGPNRARLSVAMAPGRTGDAGAVLASLGPALDEMPEVEVTYALDETSLESLMGSRGAAIEVEITGDDLTVLRELTDDLKERLSALATMTGVRTSFQDGQPELDLGLRQEVAASFGLTPDVVAETLTRRLSGEEAGELEEGQRARTIRVGFEDVDFTELPQVRVDAPGGAILTVADIADPRLVEGPREILRDGQRRIGRVSADLAAGVSLSDAVTDVESALPELAIPPGYRVAIGGEERERAESFGSLKFALILSLVLIYMVMASLFESLLHPFTVMLTLPLAGLGVVFTFAALDRPLSVMAYIGIIMLGGIAVNAAIILVDRINQLREGGGKDGGWWLVAGGEGKEADGKRAAVRAAILQAVEDRFRPIMMTSGTTVLALLPMALGLGEGAAMRAPMALAVIGGMVSSTLMTLVVIPVVYELIENLRSNHR